MSYMLVTVLMDGLRDGSSARRLSWHLANVRLWYPVCVSCGVREVVDAFGGSSVR
jgi:hypothetical protein